jgi:hypothetical protein
MKTKIIVSLVLLALASFSFTLSKQKNKTTQSTKEVGSTQSQQEPMGGFVSESKF